MALSEGHAGWTKVQNTYENVHHNLGLVLLFVHTKEEHGKGLDLLVYNQVVVTCCTDGRSMGSTVLYNNVRNKHKRGSK